MPATRSELHDLIDRLPDDEVPAAARFLQFLSQEDFGPGFAQSVRKGIKQADSGETIVCSSYEEMVEKLLGPE